MTLADKTIELLKLFESVRDKLRALPRINFCQDLPPKGEYFQAYQMHKGESGIMVKTPKGDGLFVRYDNYKKLLGTAQKTQENEIYSITEEGIMPLTTQDKILIAELGHLLLEYKSK